MGCGFAEKYYKRSNSGIFLKPFLLIFFAALSPFFIDILTCAVDHRYEMLKMDMLTNQMHELQLKGKIEESKEVLNHLLVIGKTSSKGIFTKLNVVLGSLIEK